mmetsp:Transcript_7226/g.26423  ORF Transcript_7226/g.26423 Transcript_7226/m.26423 type:complete len:226 (-) Transcript_7226:79-756(-)
MVSPSARIVVLFCEYMISLPMIMCGFSASDSTNATTSFQSPNGAFTSSSLSSLSATRSTPGLIAHPSLLASAFVIPLASTFAANNSMVSSVSVTFFAPSAATTMPNNPAPAPISNTLVCSVTTPRRANSQISALDNVVVLSLAVAAVACSASARSNVFAHTYLAVTYAMGQITLDVSPQNLSLCDPRWAIVTQSLTRASSSPRWRRTTSSARWVNVTTAARWSTP